MHFKCFKMKKSFLLVVLKWGAFLGAALAVCELVKMLARNIQYEAGNIFSILLLIVIIVFLYAGIKEYRDDLYEGYIRFPKAFGAGAAVALVSFVVVFAYLLIHYQYIEKNGLERMNQRNVELFYSQLEKKSVTQDDAQRYLDKTDSVMRSKYTLMSQNNMFEEGCENFILEKTEMMLTAYNERVMLRPQIDTGYNTYGQFSAYAQSVFHDVYVNLVSNVSPGDSCYQSLSTLVNNACNDMAQVDIRDIAYQNRKKEVAHYTSILPVALNYAVWVLLYGIFLSIFVALYLTKKKEEIPEDGDQESGVSDQNIK